MRDRSNLTSFIGAVLATLVCVGLSACAPTMKSIDEASATAIADEALRNAGADPSQHSRTVQYDESGSRWVVSYSSPLWAPGSEAHLIYVDEHTGETQLFPSE